MRLNNKINLKLINITTFFDYGTYVLDVFKNVNDKFLNFKLCTLDKRCKMVHVL